MSKRTILAICSASMISTSCGINSSITSPEIISNTAIPERTNTFSQDSFSILSAPYKKYNSGVAVAYAKAHFNTPYNTNKGNLFPNFDGVLSGGNCTNFISQAILAGLVGSTTIKTIYDQRKEFDADKSSSQNIPQWYFFSTNDRGSAWAGADNLYQYARNNKASYKGLHFSYVTHDTPSKYLDYGAVKTGDVVFADWTGDGRIDHSMLVTGKHDGTFSVHRGYNRVRLTYQSQNKTDIGLGDLNEQYKKKALFYVYRPVDYNPQGL